MALRKPQPVGPRVTKVLEELHEKAFEKRTDHQCTPLNALYYETEGMASLRRMLTTEHTFTDSEFNTFKFILATLEKKGFKLRGPAV